MKEYRFRIGQKAYRVTVEGIKDGKASVNVNGVDYSLEVEDVPGTAIPAPQTAEAPAKEPVRMPDAASPAAGKAVKSPLPGVILSVDVNEGQTVARGTRIAVLEAMKMENDILAECDGTVGRIFVQKGDSLLEGDRICTLE